MCTRSEKADFLIVWSYQKIISENIVSEKAFSNHIRSGFLVPYQKSRFLIPFSNSIRSGLETFFVFQGFCDPPKKFLEKAISYG